MASFNLDFSGVQSREPLPEGTYSVKVEKIEITTAKTSGNPMWKVTLGVMDDAYQGRKLFTNLVIQQDCMWKLQEFLSACGYGTEALVEGDTEDFIGAECMVKVAQREYQGDIQNEIKKFL